MITPEQILQAANEHAEKYKGAGQGTVVRSRNGFISGADWALEMTQWVKGCPKDNNYYVFKIEFRENGKPAFEILYGYIDEKGELYYYNDEWTGWIANEVISYYMSISEPPKE